MPKVFNPPPPVVDPAALSAFNALWDIVRNEDTYKKRIAELQAAEVKAREYFDQAKLDIEAEAKKTLDHVTLVAGQRDDALNKRAKELDAREAALDTATSELQTARNAATQDYNAKLRDVKAASDRLVADQNELRDTQDALVRREQQLADKEREVDARVSRLDAAMATR